MDKATAYHCLGVLRDSLTEHTNAVFGLNESAIKGDYRNKSYSVRVTFDDPEDIARLVAALKVKEANEP